MEIIMAIMLLLIIPLKILELIVWNTFRVAEALSPVLKPVLVACVFLAALPLILPLLLVGLLIRILHGGGQTGGGLSGGGRTSGALSGLVDAFGGGRR